MKKEKPCTHPNPVYYKGRLVCPKCDKEIKIEDSLDKGDELS